MGGWLCQFMVERLGAWVGIEMLSLSDFLLALAERVSPTSELGRRIDPLRELTHILAERVIRAESPRDPIHFRLKPLLDICSGPDGLDREMLFVHCHAIAAAFNRYELDRPDLIEAWMSADRAWQEVGAAWTVQAQSVECWQRALWRDVVAEKWLPHQQWCAVGVLISALNRGECPIQIREIGFVGIFALSSIPPLAMNLLVALGRHVRVHLYLLTPSLTARAVSSG